MDTYIFFPPYILLLFIPVWSNWVNGVMQLSKFCLADYVAKVDIIYLKGNKFTEKINDKNDDDRCDSSISNESEDRRSQCSDLLYKTKKEQNIRKEKCQE